MKKVHEIGKRWERQVAKELDGKRQPSSGAFGTLTKDAKLTGDVVVPIPWLSRALHVECKYGYGSSKSISVKRDWLVKVRKEADLARRYPALALKFRDVTSDVESAKLICFDFETWKKMMQEFSYIYYEYLAILKEQYEENDNGV